MIPKLIEDYCRRHFNEELELPDRIDIRVPKDAAWEGTEHDLQKAFFRWLMEIPSEFDNADAVRALLWLPHAIPNGGGRSKAEAGKLVAEGVKGGVPDVFISIPRNKECGLYLEFKTNKGKPSDDQRCFLLMLDEQGYQCHVVNDLDLAKQVFLEYMGWDEMGLA